MTDGVRLYAGTQQGLLVWRERNGHWDQVCHEFRDGVIDGLVGSRADPERVYLSSASDGVYKTEDGGSHWTRIFEGDVRALTLDPNDESVLYVGTEPVHLYRSEDGGAHWEEVAGLLNLPEDVRKKWWTPYPPATGHVRYVFVHADDPNTLYICLEHGGVHRSFDRGETWEDVSGGIDYLDMHMVQSLPHSTSRYYCTSARGFFTSEDPGDGWARAEEGLNRSYSHDFIFLPPTREGETPPMLVSTADGSPGFWKREERGARAALFRSLDAGQSWQRVTRGLPDDMDHMVWGMALHPHDPDAVFAAIGATQRGSTFDTYSDVTPALSHVPGQVLLSHDRGESWEPLPLQLPADRLLWAAPD